MFMRGVNALWIASILTAAAWAADLTGQTDAGRQVTFNKDIASIFQKSCQNCHHPGTSAPMPLMTYNDARPWARAIRDRVLRREMPPWRLDKTVGIRQYKNDISLSDDQIATIVKWVDGGAPQGSPAELPKPLDFGNEHTWFIGQPDMLVTTDDFKMY